MMVSRDGNTRLGHHQREDVPHGTIGFFKFIFAVFSLSLCVEQWGKGQKEREVLGTSSQWVALSGHCPSATVSNVKGGEIGDGVAEHVLILKDCHQTNPVEGRTTTTLSKPTREGTEPSPPSLHISYSFTFHSPPTSPMWLPRGTITTWHVP